MGPWGPWSLGTLDALHALGARGTGSPGFSRPALGTHGALGTLRAGHRAAGGVLPAGVAAAAAVVWPVDIHKQASSHEDLGGRCPPLPEYADRPKGCQSWGSFCVGKQQGEQSRANRLADFAGRTHNLSLYPQIWPCGPLAHGENFPIDLADLRLEFCRYMVYPLCTLRRINLQKRTCYAAIKN